MSKKFSNLLTSNSPAPVLLSNGILLHNKVDLDALGLSSYKKHFNAAEFPERTESTEVNDLSKLSEPKKVSGIFESNNPSEAIDQIETPDSNKPIQLISKDSSESTEPNDSSKINYQKEKTEIKIYSPAPEISKIPFSSAVENSDHNLFGSNIVEAPKDFSWMATLLNYDGGLCGGILLNEYWVLTAYHYLEEAVGVQVGDQFREVEEIIKNEDLMLLRLKTPVVLKNINLIKMASKEQNFKEGTIGYVSGWGSPQRRASDINEEKFEGNNQKDHLTHQKNLQVVKLKIVSNSRLHAAEKPTDKINIESPIDSEKQFTVGNPDDTSRDIFNKKLEESDDTCQGDSGSPFISKSTDGEWYIVGIVSWDVGFGISDGVYVRVSYFRDWIEQTMNHFLKKEDTEKISQDSNVDSEEDSYRDSENSD